MAAIRWASFLLSAVALACSHPAQAVEVVIHASFRQADDIVVTAPDPRVKLDRGGAVDGLPVLQGGTAAVIPWDTIKRLIFIPGDPPLALAVYRDGSERTIEIERCSIAAGGTTVDIHDIAEIEIR